MGQKVPGYAATLAKQGLGSGEGLKEERSQKSNMDGESMFEQQDEELEGDIPEKARERIEKLEDQNTRMNIELKEKNERIIEMLTEMEELKI